MNNWISSERRDAGHLSSSKGFRTSFIRFRLFSGFLSGNTRAYFFGCFRNLLRRSQNACEQNKGVVYFTQNTFNLARTSRAEHQRIQRSNCKCWLKSFLLLFPCTCTSPIYTIFKSQSNLPEGSINFWISPVQAKTAYTNPKSRQYQVHFLKGLFVFWFISSLKMGFKGNLAEENSRHFATPPQKFLTDDKLLPRSG